MSNFPSNKDAHLSRAEYDKKYKHLYMKDPYAWGELSHNLYSKYGVIKQQPKNTRSTPGQIYALLNMWRPKENNNSANRGGYRRKTHRRKTHRRKTHRSRKN